MQNFQLLQLWKRATYNNKYSSHKADKLNNKDLIRFAFKIMKLNGKNIPDNHNCCYVSLHDDINK